MITLECQRRAKKKNTLLCAALNIPRNSGLVLKESDSKPREGSSLELVITLLTMLEGRQRPGGLKCRVGLAACQIIFTRSEEITKEGTERTE